MNHLEIEALSKRYRSGVEALKGLSLQIGPGVLGLLGPNGAGKSTLMRMIATVMKPTSGAIRWNGQDVLRSPNTLRSVLGYLPQDSGVYPNLNAREFLGYVAALKGMPQREARSTIDRLLEQLNLTAAEKRPLGAFSGGMRQRVGIAQALLNDPLLAIVDEPTVGLDPEERARFRELLTGIAGDRIVILSTHIVSDVETIAERVVMVAAGSVIADGAPDVLASQLKGKVWEGLIAAEQLEALRATSAVTSVVRRRDGMLVRVCAEAAPVGFVAALPSLEEAYLVNVRASRAA